MRLKFMSIWWIILVVITGFGAVHAGSLENRLAVLTFKALKIDQADADIISDQIRSELVNQRRYQVIDRKNMETILKEQKFSLSDCTDTSCAVKAGAVLNVKWILIGTLSKVEKEFLVTVDLVDVETAEIRRSTSESAASLKQLIKSKPRIVAELSSDEIGDLAVSSTQEMPAPKRDTPALDPKSARDAETSYRVPLPVVTGFGDPPTIEIVDAPKSSMSLKDAALVVIQYRGKDDRCIDGYRYRLDDQEIIETKRSRVELTDVSRGTHVFQVQAKDCDGNYSQPESVEFKVVNQPPSVSITLPKKGENVYGKQLKVELSGTDDGKVEKYRCALNDPKTAIEQTDATFAYEPADGMQRIYAQVVDDMGVESEWIEQEVEYTFDDGSVKTTSQSVGREQGSGPTGYIFIPPGTYMMGSLTSESDREPNETPHSVTISKGFWMKETEVTQSEYESMISSNPSHFKGSMRPVENVTWYDAIEYCNKQSQKEGLISCYERSGDKVTWNRSANGYRLPTEAEWEYACRGGTTGAYAGSLDEMGWYVLNSGGKTRDVKQKKANAWGIYDMHGNVWEWCWDWYGEYPSGSVTDPMGPSYGSDRLLRGASWLSDKKSCCSSFRNKFAPDAYDDCLGFRLVRIAE